MPRRFALPSLALAGILFAGCSDSPSVGGEKTPPDTSGTGTVFDLRDFVSGKRPLPPPGDYRISPEWVGIPEKTFGDKDRDKTPEPYRLNRLTITRTEVSLNAETEPGSWFRAGFSFFFGPEYPLETVSGLKSYPDFRKYLGEPRQPYPWSLGNHGDVCHWSAGWKRCFPVGKNRIHAQDIQAGFLSRSSKTIGIDEDKGVIERLLVMEGDFRCVANIPSAEAAMYPSESEKVRWLAEKTRELIDAEPEPLRKLFLARFAGGEAYRKALQELRRSPDPALLALFIEKADPRSSVSLWLPYRLKPAIGLWNPTAANKSERNLIQIDSGDFFYPYTAPAKQPVSPALDDAFIEALAETPSLATALRIGEHIVRVENVRELRVDELGLEIKNTAGNIGTSGKTAAVRWDDTAHAVPIFQKALKAAVAEARRMRAEHGEADARETAPPAVSGEKRRNASE